MTTLHTIVREAWAEALGHDDFTDDDHYFSVGGTSLSALKVMSSIGAAVGRKLSLRLLFDNQTVSALEGAVAVVVAPEQQRTTTKESSVDDVTVG